MKKNNTWIFIAAFFVILFILKFIISKEISPIVKPSYEFKFSTFLVYTYFLTLFTYSIKLILFYGLFKSSFFVFDIKSPYSITSIIIAAESIKLIFINGSKIIAFYALNKEMTLEQFTSFESSYEFSSMLNISDLNIFKGFINLVNVFDLIYLATLLFLFINFNKLAFSKYLKTIAMPYILILLIIEIFKNIMFF